MLVKQEGYLLLTDPHKPGRRDEYKRIKDLGGFVWEANGSYRINGQLAVSRAIGDYQFKPFVSPRPDVRVVDFTGSEEFLVIGCDGLWDVVKPQEVIEAVYSQIKENPGKSRFKFIKFLGQEYFNFTAFWCTLQAQHTLMFLWIVQIKIIQEEKHNYYTLRLSRTGLEKSVELIQRLILLQLACVKLCIKPLIREWIFIICCTTKLTWHSVPQI